MAGSWKYYDEQAYTSKKREQKERRCPPTANFLAAVSYIQSLLDGKNITWAALGGLAMLCLGSRRAMPDVHIVVDGGAMEKLRVYLEKDTRTIIPKDMNSLFPAKVLVGTGPSNKDSNCTEEVNIEVNIIPSGSNKTPSFDILRKHMVILRLATNGVGADIKGLDILHLVQTTLQLAKNPDLAWDPKIDLVFLCEKYPKEVASIRHLLNKNDLYNSFFWRRFFAVGLSPELRRQCSQVLLGKDRPPSPPRPSSGASSSIQAPTPPIATPKISNHSETLTEQTGRPPLMTHKSSPLLPSASYQHSQNPSALSSVQASTPKIQSLSTHGQDQILHATYQPVPPQGRRQNTEPQTQRIGERFYAGTNTNSSPNLRGTSSANGTPTHSRTSSRNSSPQPKPSNGLLPPSSKGHDQNQLRRPASFHSGLSLVSRGALPQPSTNPNQHTRNSVTNHPVPIYAHGRTHSDQIRAQPHHIHVQSPPLRSGPVPQMQPFTGGTAPPQNKTQVPSPPTNFNPANSQRTPPTQQSLPHRPSVPSGAQSGYIAFVPSNISAVPASSQRTVPTSSAHTPPYLVQHDVSPLDSAGASSPPRPQQPQPQPQPQSRAQRMSITTPEDLPPSLLPGGIHKRSTFNNVNKIIHPSTLPAISTQGETTVFELPASITPRTTEPETGLGLSGTKYSPFDPVGAGVFEGTSPEGMEAKDKVHEQKKESAKAFGSEPQDYEGAGYGELEDVLHGYGVKNHESESFSKDSGDSKQDPDMCIEPLSFASQPRYPVDQSGIQPPSLHSTSDPGHDLSIQHAIPVDSKISGNTKVSSMEEEDEEDYT